MDKKMAFVVAMFGVVLWAGTVFAEPSVPGTHAMWKRFEAASLIGQRVNDHGGNYLGEITGFVIDQANDRVALIVLSGVPGLGVDRVAIPYGCLKRSEEYAFEAHFPGVADFSMLPQYPADSPLYSIPQPIYPSWGAEVYRSYGLSPYWTKDGERMPLAMDFYQSGQLFGAEVGMPGGEVEARISNLVIDSSIGHISLLILSDIKGRGDNLVAVPFDALYRTSGGTFALNSMGDELASASVFHRPDAHNYRYAERVYRFFGLQSSWSERGKGLDLYRWGGEAQDF
jgi:sporulation protein YlmC with PRC-barrel domain